MTPLPNDPPGAVPPLPDQPTVVEQMEIEVFGGHMVKADGESPWADSRHVLWRVAPQRWVENVTTETFVG